MYLPPPPKIIYLESIIKRICKKGFDNILDSTYIKGKYEIVLINKHKLN